MPNGWYFGRVSAVATDSAGNVYVFQRGEVADPLAARGKSHAGAKNGDCHQFAPRHDPRKKHLA